MQIHGLFAATLFILLRSPVIRQGNLFMDFFRHLQRFAESTGPFFFFFLPPFLLLGAVRLRAFL